MKAEINSGQVIIRPENETEKYALKFLTENVEPAQLFRIEANGEWEPLSLEKLLRKGAGNIT